MHLLKDKGFMPLIRNYNASFSFISFNANSDINLSKNNIYALRIQGMIHHRIGPIIDDEDKDPKCAQIYFYGDNSVNYRLKYSSALNALVLIQIQAMLLDDCNNPFVMQFKKASQLIKKFPSSKMKIIIITNKNADRRIYNKPSVEEIAVLIPYFGNENEPTNREAIVYRKSGGLEKVDVNNSNYDPMAYPLRFPTGQAGWQYNTIELNLETNYKTSPQNNNDEITDEQDDIDTLIDQDKLVIENEFNNELFSENLTNLPIPP